MLKAFLMRDLARTLALFASMIGATMTFACDKGATETESKAPAPKGQTHAPSGSVSAAPAPTKKHPLAGRWRAQAEAEKTSVRLAPAVPTKTWARDNGKKASGTITLSITIDADGRITGSISGALGNLTVMGKADQTRLRAVVTSKSPGDDDSMNGVLTAAFNSGALTFKLRTSGPKGNIVRGASGTLKPQR